MAPKTLRGTVADAVGWSSPGGGPLGRSGEVGCGVGWRPARRFAGFRVVPHRPTSFLGPYWVPVAAACSPAPALGGHAFVSVPHPSFVFAFPSRGFWVTMRLRALCPSPIGPVGLVPSGRVASLPCCGLVAVSRGVPGLPCVSVLLPVLACSVGGPTLVVVPLVGLWYLVSSCGGAVRLFGGLMGFPVARR